MKMSALEVRVIGVLMEKAVTTPDQYPLSLNALTTGCNQKTNREPVMNVDDSDVLAALDSLTSKALVSEVRIGTRVSKYQHRFSGTEFAEVKLTKAQQAIMCLLFLRGPQTAGELRSRSQRLFEFTAVQQVEENLALLQEKEYVCQLGREPGKRESRFAHLFGDVEPVVATDGLVATGADSTTGPQLEERVIELEQRVAHLEALLNDLMN